MANPYESTDGVDPFQEKSVDPPTVYAAMPRVTSPPTVPITIATSPHTSDKNLPPGFLPEHPELNPGKHIDPTVNPAFFGDAPYDKTGVANPTIPNQQPPIQPAGEGQQNTTSQFWTLAFYQQFFDVTTRQVLLRMSNTLIPLNPPDFLMGRNWHYNGDVVNGDAANAIFVQDGVELSRKPDLYGPFWICTTLWMTLGIVSNVMGRLAYKQSSHKDVKWYYDFSMVSVACMLMYLYCFVFGAIVWGIMKWKNLPTTLVDIVCTYGYSMFIFELVALLCMVPIAAVQWVVVVLGGAWSTAYLLLNFWRMWRGSLEREWFIGIVAFVTVFHMLLTMSFKFYFLNYPV